jgi:hypothetical protein
VVLSGYLAYSTTKTGRHDKAEILLKVALNTKNQIKFKKKLNPTESLSALGRPYVVVFYLLLILFSLMPLYVC